ncbi:MAG: TPM domain-containing protein [Ruminococcaceae bacterium]|nr:TPM domain-containing protein [Oscillospiraceae bacterium]
MVYNICIMSYQGDIFVKKLLYIISFILIISFLLPFCASAHSAPDEISVHDFSGVLSDGIKTYIKSKNDILFSETEAKIIFVTTQDSGEQNINDFCEDLYSNWRISEIGRRNSIFMVVDTKKEEYAFLIGKSIRLALPESDMYKYIVDNFEPHLLKRDYDKAVFATYNAIAKWYEEKYEGLNLNLDNDVFKYVGGEKTKDKDIKESNLWLWIVLIVSLILMVVVLKIKRNIELKIRQHERRVLRKKFKIDIDKITNS